LKANWILDHILGNLSWLIFAIIIIPVLMLKQKRDRQTKKSKQKLGKKNL
jgi:hypothetical protein